MEQQFEPKPENTAPKASPYADSPYYSYYEQNGYAHPEKGNKTPKTKSGRRGISALLAAVLILVSCLGTAAAMHFSWQKKYDALSEAVNNKLAVMDQQLEQAVKTEPYVPVTVPAQGLTPAQVFAQNADAVVIVRSNTSGGTGFVISADGYIVSNYHVIDGAAVLRVVMHDGSQYDAKVVGYESTNDIALLKIEAENLKCVTIGSSSQMHVGDQVVAIGNALLDLTSSLTVGYISGKDRIINTDGTYINMFQTDAAINSGNSGGPLFNMKGEVIGINTAKYSGYSNSGATIEGIGFAIPIDDVLGMIEDIRQYGYVVSPYLGVTVRDVDPEVISYYGFPAGAYVESVVDGLSAQEAGIQPKDIIVNIGGYKITSVSELTRILRKFKPGETTTVTVFRSGAEVNLKITLGAKPAPTQPEATEPPTEMPSQGGNNQMPWWFDFMNPFFGMD